MSLILKWERNLQLENKNNNVYLIIEDKARYNKKNINPDKIYPEYFSKDDSLSDENKVYDMVRQCLYLRGYDCNNYGKNIWNPLGDIIKPKQNIVIKPNLVNDYNHGNDNVGLDCLITNVSVTRAICDYCLIALRGEGKITICDAPIQDCNMDKLLENSNYNKLISYYKEKNQPVYFEDLRLERRIVNRFGIKKQTELLLAKHQYIEMNSLTAFADLTSEYEYNVPNYDKDITKKYHNREKHVYSISDTVLNSDTIINICKPKCHRYAGITASMKNCVGMVTEKETLPHRRIGEILEGGDSYEGKSWIKKQIDNILIKQVKAENDGMISKAICLRFIYGFLYYLRKIKGEDSSLKGCWHGNDTIWRTILDLNYIIRYAGKDGVLKNEKQRNVLNFGDMIIAGQHNGPMSPEPKPLGIIICSEDEVAFDITVSSIMGFEPKKIPLYKNIMRGDSWEKYIIPILVSNEKRISGKLTEVIMKNQWKFKPHDAWKGYIEVD